MTIRFGRAAPVVPVRDVDAALGFYRDRLGLAVTFENGDPADYVVLKADAAEVHLARCSNPAPRAQNVLHLIVSDAAALHRACVDGGAPVVEALRDAPWGMRTFVVEDPDGHRLDIGQPLSKD